MKIIQINATCGVGSTGKICLSISKLLNEKNIENYILYSSGQSDFPQAIKCSNEKYIKTQALKSRILGNYGFNSAKSTKKILEEIDTIKPDIVHLHNIHGHDCDVGKLFTKLKQDKIKTVWTFHDAWAFTAYCPLISDCEKWKKDCKECSEYKKFSWFFNRSELLYKRKKELFSDVDMTIVTPSKWLAEIVKCSFLKDIPLKIINNGIDLSIFSPSPSSFRKENNIPREAKLILGVAFDWEKRKGLEIFISLSQKLDKNKYKIVLVGVDEKTKQDLPPEIIPIERTRDQKALAEIYTAADVFANPTSNDNFPTVNIEALACGTPVVTFNAGGSGEILDESCGKVIPEGDLEAFEKEIIKICDEKPYSESDCLKRASSFDENDKFSEYIELYKSLLEV